MRKNPEPRAAEVPTLDEGKEAVARVRLRARRRLVGALVLLGAGVIGFPLLFETKPRPLPADVPIVAAGDALPPANTPGVAAARPPAPASAANPGVEPAASAGQGAASVASGNASAGPVLAPVAPVAPSAPQPASAPPVAVSRPAAAASAAGPSRPAPVVPRQAAGVPSRPAAPAPGGAAPAPGEGRFIVQVGAYSDAATLREARQRVEKLGLKTYTQVIEGDGARRTRVRVGPFATRAEALAAAARLKAAGLPGNLLTL